jgi:enoyl-CoA hydratase
VTEAATEPEVIVERRGSAGVLTLNRPKALNALNHGMVKLIQQALDQWRDDPAITRIIMQGAGGRAYCAGGDIRHLYELGRAGRVAEARPFWRDEYLLNHAMSEYPKPVISLIDGIVMGGGVGVSIHNSHRVASEKLMFAMPEVGIGFFPDVGASYFLPRLPDGIGIYLAVTGARIGLGDALALGLVTHALESAHVPDLATALTGPEALDTVLKGFSIAAPEAPLLTHRMLISKAFVPDSISAIMERLSQLASGGSAFAAATLETMRTKSPTSMALALEQVRRGAVMTLRQALQMEYRIVCRVAEAHDFYEGVRAVLVDKDNTPRWRPADIDDVSSADIAGYFAPLADDIEA